MYNKIEGIKREKKRKSKNIKNKREIVKKLKSKSCSY